MIRLALLAAALLALPDPPAPQGDDPVTIHGADGDLLASAGPVTVMFNPKEIMVDKPVPWKRQRAVEGDAPPEEFTSGPAYTVWCDFFFDSYEEDQQTETLNRLAKLVESAQPILVTWGKRLWTSALLTATPRPPENGKPQLVVSTKWKPFTLLEPHEAYPFTVDIPGVPDAATLIRDVHIDPVPLPPGKDPLHARFTIAAPHGIAPDLLKWQQTWDAGNQIRRSITVTIFNTVRVPVRTVTLNAGGPIHLTIDDPNAPVPHVTLDVTFDGMKLASSDDGTLWPAPRTTPFPAYYFEVEIRGVTYPFRSCEGLKVEQGVVENEEGGIDAPKPRLTGQAKWPPLTLVGEPKVPMVAFLEWVDAAAIGQAVRQPIRITPVFIVEGKPRPGKSLWLEGAAPVRYVFPELSGLWSEGDKTERTELPPLYGVVK